MLSVLVVAARALNATRKNLRHRWRRMRVVRGAIQQSVRVARQLTWYQPPGEQRRCPACAAARLKYMMPLAYAAPPVAYGWRYGFVCGCRRCGLLFSNPLPDEQQLSKMYSPEGAWGAGRQEATEPSVNRKRLEDLFAPVRSDIDVLHPLPGASVLDFGCGAGGMLDALQEVGWETHGFEPATRTAFARHREITALPDEPQFDLVVVHHVLEHVRNPLDILRRLARAMREGAYMLISVPDLDDVAQHGDFEYVLRSKTHVLAYGTASVTWLTAAAGLRVVSSRRSEGSRRRVVLARRERHAVDPPAAPLKAAQSALGLYFVRFPHERPSFQRVPVRLRAALCNLQRDARHATD